MAGMEALGRVLDIIPIASGKPFKMRGASAVMVSVTESTAVITVNERSSFGGSDTALSVIKNVYASTATDGTAAWTKLVFASVSTYTHGNAGPPVLTSVLSTVFHIYTSMLTGPFNYLNLVATGSGLCSVTLYDMVHQRAPANLEIKGS